VLTTFDLDEHVYDALRAGASGFLLRTLHPKTCTGRCSSSPKGAH
jgi:DNA-binding NarL/FixJ family response regulator